MFSGGSASTHAHTAHGSQCETVKRLGEGRPFVCRGSRWGLVGSETVIPDVPRNVPVRVACLSPPPLRVQARVARAFPYIGLAGRDGYMKDPYFTFR